MAGLTGAAERHLSLREQLRRPAHLQHVPSFDADEASRMGCLDDAANQDAAACDQVYRLAFARGTQASAVRSIQNDHRRDDLQSAGAGDRRQRAANGDGIARRVDERPLAFRRTGRRRAIRQDDMRSACGRRRYESKSQDSRNDRRTDGPERFLTHGAHSTPQRVQGIDLKRMRHWFSAQRSAC